MSADAIVHRNRLVDSPGIHAHNILCGAASDAAQSHLAEKLSE